MAKKLMQQNQAQRTTGSMMFHPGGTVPTAPRRMTETTKPAAPAVSVMNRSTGRIEMAGQHVGVIRKLSIPSKRPSAHNHPKGNMVGYNEQDLNAGRKGRKA